MLTVTRRFTFSAAHRLLGHEGRCKHLHGHNYVAEVTVQGVVLDEVGRLIDFHMLQSKIGMWIDEHWDHAFLCRSDDTILRALSDRVFIFHQNPTAEVMAQHLFGVSAKAIDGEGLAVDRVKLWETENSYAEAYHR